MNNEVKTINGYDVKDVKAVRTYDTVALMKADRKLKQGQHVKTRGYYTINDGGSAEYYITSSQSESDYQENLENGLKAILIIENNTINIKQFGAKGDGISDDTQSIQNALKYNGNNIKNIFFNDAIGYVIENTLYLYSNTEIDFNNQKILIGSNEVLILNNEIEGNAQYIENITLKNGYFDGTTDVQSRYCNSLKFGLLRANNLIVENNTFYKISNELHTFDMGGCTNVIIKDNYWHNVYNSEGNRQAELIQLDNAFYTGLPYWDNDSELYNNQGCKNVKIIGNRFGQDDSSNGYINAIGTHSVCPNVFHEQIYIANNIFDEPSYGNIKFIAWKDVIIENNIFLIKNVQDVEDSAGRANIIGVYGSYVEDEETKYAPSENINILNNTFRSLNSNNYVLGIRFTGRTEARHKNISVLNNSFEGTYIDTDNQGSNFIVLDYVDDSKVISNSILKAKNGLYGTNSKNILISNNILKDCRTYDNISSNNTNIYFNDNIFIDRDNKIINLKDSSLKLDLTDSTKVTLESDVTLPTTFDNIASKQGEIVNISTLIGVTIASNNTFVKVMNIPTPFRPNDDKIIPCYGATNNGYNLKYLCSARITSGGDIYIRNDSGTEISLLNINGIYSLQ